jgi:hypothetical protein
MEIIVGNGNPKPEARVLIAPEWIAIQESEKRLKRKIKIKIVA